MFSGEGQGRKQDGTEEKDVYLLTYGHVRGTWRPHRHLAVPIMQQLPYLLFMTQANPAVQCRLSLLACLWHQEETAVLSVHPFCFPSQEHFISRARLSEPTEPIVSGLGAHAPHVCLLDWWWPGPLPLPYFGPPDPCVLSTGDQAWCNDLHPDVPCISEEMACFQMSSLDVPPPWRGPCWPPGPLNFNSVSDPLFHTPWTGFPRSKWWNGVVGWDIPAVSVLPAHSLGAWPLLQALSETRVWLRDCYPALEQCTQWWCPSLYTSGRTPVGSQQLSRHWEPLYSSISVGPAYQPRPPVLCLAIWPFTVSYCPLQWAACLCSWWLSAALLASAFPGSCCPPHSRKSEVKVVSDSLWPHGLYSPWNSPAQSTGVGSLSLLQGIFPTSGSNPGLLHCWWILYYLSHKGSPKPGSEAPPPFTSEQPPRSYLVVPAPLPAHLFQLVLENGVSS